MRNIILTGLLLAGISVHAQDYLPSEARIIKTVSYLASDKLKGRGTGEKGGMKASRFVQQRFTPRQNNRTFRFN